MEIPPQDWPKVVFRKVIRKDTGSVSMDGEMIRVLVALDGQKTVSQVAGETGMDANAIRKPLDALLRLGLVETAHSAAGYLGKAFLDSMRLHLSAAIGPMAEIVIEDVLADLNLRIGSVPIPRAAELISLLAREIPDDENRTRFKKAMVELLHKT